MRLKEWISHKGFKQIEVATDNHINHSQLNKHLNGWQPLPTRHQETLAKYLGVSVEEVRTNQVQQRKGK